MKIINNRKNLLKHSYVIRSVDEWCPKDNLLLIIFC